ncbi:MAG: dihydrodipicolinate synthase family protein [Acidobacteriota bacterium]|nr:dihydrodipicolinate synthase family protein [Acidobacteriota bacterium]
MRLFSGLYHPLVTPFASDGGVDTGAIARNAAKYLATPLTGLVVLGSNGESPQLDDDESDRVIAAVRDVVPQDRPVLAGAARESTRATIAACRRAASLGVSAVMVRTPSFYKNMMTTDAFVRHYTEVAEASPAPVLLYNVTLYTGVTLQADAVGLLSQHPNIVGIKESGNDMQLLGDYLAEATDDFVVLCGSATSYYSALALGAHGGVLALSGIVPDLCMELARLVSEGRYPEARALQSRLLPMARAIGAQHGVPALKAALSLIGFETGDPRPPLRPCPPAVVTKLRTELTMLGVLSEETIAPL